MERYGDVKLPEVEVVDMKLARKRLQVDGTFSMATVAAAREAFDRGEQVIFFHNRRGYAPFARCKACAFVPKCENCDVSLTYHRHTNRLVCHYCGASYQIPTVCPVCREPEIEIVGYGRSVLRMKWNVYSRAGGFCGWILIPHGARRHMVR